MTAGRSPGTTGLPFRAGLERSRTHVALAAGDLLVVVVVLWAGLSRHGVDPVGSPRHAAAVIGPFVVGWAIAAVLAGAYREASYATPGDAAVNAAGAWLLAALIGAGLRATPFLPGDSPPIFVAVVAGTGALAIAGWRGVVASVLASR